MKVLLLNGSPHKEGCTYTALKEIENTLNEEGIETEIFNLGTDVISGCRGCGACRKIGKCVIDDKVNEFVKLAESFGINAERITKPGETEVAVKKAIKDNEPIVLDIVVDKNECLPMVPPGAGISEMLGEYKLEKDK